MKQEWQIKFGGNCNQICKKQNVCLIVAIMVIVGLMSGVLSNTGTAAVLIPVVIGIAAKSGYKRSKITDADSDCRNFILCNHRI